MERGCWWKFQDANGQGFCQTDFLLERVDFVLVLECKHTWTPEGHSQLEQLYRPVVERALGKPMLGVQVCRFLTSDAPKVAGICSSLLDAMSVAKNSSRPAVLHWLGKSKLWPSDANGLPSHIAAPRRAA